MNLSRTLKRYEQRYYAPGSPLRYLRKAFLSLSNPAANSQRSRVGHELCADMPADLRERVEILDKTGYSPAGNEIDPKLLAELDQATTERLNSDKDRTAIRSFFTRLTSDADLTTDSIFVRFALQPAVQKLVCAYFGKVPYLADVQLLMSHGSDAPTWEESQLWHRDFADSKTIKLWVYLTPVESDEKGPFTYLDVEDSNRVKNSFFPGRVSDEAMEASGLAKRAKVVYGKRLDTFYIDTSRCYHLGSRLPKGQIRVAYVATFITHTSLYPFNNRIVTKGDLSEPEKLLLSL